MADLDLHLPGIIAGDSAAFGRWVAGAEAPLRDSLRPFAASVDTEALVQEALLRIWQVAERFVPDGRPNGLLRLAVRIARNLAVSEVRRLRTAPVEAQDLERTLLLLETQEVRGEPDPLLRRLIAQCHEKLPGKPSQALGQRLMSHGNEPDQTLAERIGMRLNTFLQNVTRARRLMAECLKQGGVELEERA